MYLLALAGHYLGLDSVVRRRQGPGLVVLMFHRFSEVPDPHPITVTPRTFRRVAAGCRDRELLGDLDSGLRALDEGRAATRYAITVDGGYHYNLQALAGLGRRYPPRCT